MSPEQRRIGELEAHVEELQRQLAIAGAPEPLTTFTSSSTFFQDTVGHSYTPVHLGKFQARTVHHVKAALEKHKGEPVADVLVALIHENSLQFTRAQRMQRYADEAKAMEMRSLARRALTYLATVPAQPGEPVPLRELRVAAAMVGNLDEAR